MFKLFSAIFSPIIRIANILDDTMAVLEDEARVYRKENTKDIAQRNKAANEALEALELDLRTKVELGLASKQELKEYNSKY